jgi:thioredoxin reductase (NADPH)
VRDSDYDCVVVGGGPAGLTASIYLVRYHLSLKVVDAGKSRANWIPCTHNHAGFPGGISGADLLQRMREQAQMYGASISTGHVTRIDRTEDGFCIEWGQGTLTARTVLLATGVTNRRPSIEDRLHDEALAQGRLRYCPVCDGYEVTDTKVGVIGSGGRGVAEAAFLRGFTDDVTLIAPDTPHDFSAEEEARIEEFGIKCIDGPCRIISAGEAGIAVDTPSGEYRFDSVYPALGSDIHTELAGQLGVKLSPDGSIAVDSHQRTNVAGVYAAGDVVLGLDQISHAMGEAGVAATAIRNDLARKRPVIRERLRGNSIL